MNRKNCISELAQLWLEEKQSKVRPSTYGIYRSYVNNYIASLPDGIKWEELPDIFSKELETGIQKDLNNKTKNEITRVFNSIMQYGNNQHCIPVNIKANYYRKEHTQIPVLHEHEQIILEKILLYDIEQRKALGIYLCLYTGLRIGELCGLKREDFDTDNKLLSINRTVQRISCETGTKVIEGPTKSQKGTRIIPIPEIIMPYLSVLKDDTPQTYFLSGLESPTEPKTMENIFQRYLKKADIPLRGFHSLRHTFATRWIEADCDVKTLSEILGHADIEITLRRYVHISEKTKRININKLQPPK